MTPAQFFEQGKGGQKVRMGSDPEIYVICQVTAGSHGYVSREGEAKQIFVYLAAGLVRFKDLKGPCYGEVHLAT